MHPFSDAASCVRVWVKVAAACVREGLQLGFCFSTCRSCLQQLALGPFPPSLLALAARRSLHTSTIGAHPSHQVVQMPPNSSDEWTAALVTRSFSESYRPTALLSDLLICLLKRDPFP